MSITHSPTVRNALANLIKTNVDASGAGKLKIYSGALSTLLATFSLPSPSFGSASSGTITANSITPITASATGTAQSFSVTDGSDNVVFQGTVGVAGSGADLILNTTSLVTGGAVSVSSFTYASPV